MLKTSSERAHIFYYRHIEKKGAARGNSWNAINTPDSLYDGIIYRWNRYGYIIRKKHECEPCLNDLIEFMDQETTLVNDQ